MAMPRRPPRHHNLNSSAGLSTAASALILSADRPFAGGRPNWPPLEARSFAPHLPRTAAGRTQYFRRSPEHLGAEEVREYQLYLREEKKASWVFSTRRYLRCGFCMERRYSGTGWWSRYPTRGRRHGSPKF